MILVDYVIRLNNLAITKVFSEKILMIVTYERIPESGIFSGAEVSAWTMVMTMAKVYGKFPLGIMMELPKNIAALLYDSQILHVYN